MRRTSPLPA